MAQNEMFTAIGLIVAILLLANAFSGRELRVRPDCEIRLSDDCICYGGKVKLNSTCIVPECYSETVNNDCQDKQHIACLGRWDCMDYSCKWKCTI